MFQRQYSGADQPNVLIHLPTLTEFVTKSLHPASRFGGQLGDYDRQRHFGHRPRLLECRRREQIATLQQQHCQSFKLPGLFGHAQLTEVRCFALFTWI